MQRAYGWGGTPCSRGVQSDPPCFEPACQSYTTLTLLLTSHTHYAAHSALTDVQQLDLQCKHKAVQIVARDRRIVLWIVMAEPTATGMP